MGRIAKVSGRSLFGASRWSMLRARSRWRGIGMVVHAWLVIAVAAGLAIAFPNPVVVVSAGVVIGSRQLGLAILMHEAAHGLLHDAHRLNDRLGAWACAWPLGISLTEYRQYHLRHHTYAQQEEDPDLVLSSKFPVSGQSLVRKLVRDLTGLTFLRQRLLPMLYSFVFDRRISQADGAMLLFNAALIGLAVLNNLLWAYLLLWLVPFMTWYMAVLRVRNIAEHACVSTENNPWRVARTTHAGWIARALVAPYFVNYHAEHHLFMSAPCYRLPAIHEALQEQGRLEQEHTPIASGYIQVLRQASGNNA